MGMPASMSRDFSSSAKSRPTFLHASANYADAFGAGAEGGAVGSQGGEGTAGIVRLEQRRECAAIQPQAGAMNFNGTGQSASHSTSMTRYCG